MLTVPEIIGVIVALIAAVPFAHFIRKVAAGVEEPTNETEAKGQDPLPRTSTRPVLPVRDARGRRKRR